MSNNINNGGPAFPAGSVRKSRPAHDAGGDWVETDRVQPLHKGLTIRDYFAAKAMQGMYNDGSVVAASKLVDDSANMDAVARWSYAQADAMLRARGEA